MSSIAYSLADLNVLTPRLPPEVRAQFVAGAGVLIVNATMEELNRAGHATTAATQALRSDINHETYHVLQTVCTGYAFIRAQRIKEITVRHLEGSMWRDLRTNFGLYALRFAMRAVPERMRRRLMLERIEAVAAIAIDWNTYGARRARAPANDYSLAGADVPDLFRDLEAVEQALTTAGPSGLSAWHIIEGSAAVFQVAIEATAAGADDLDAAITAALARFDAGYGTTYTFARERCGSRAAQLILPAAALALRYERPGEAFPVLLDLLRPAAAGAEIEAARELTKRPPRLPTAGRYLGTALDVSAPSWRRLWRRWPSLYKPALAYLARADRPLDEIDALCDLARFADLPPELCSTALLLKDGFGMVGMGEIEARLRTRLAAIQLRFDGRPRWEKDTEAAIVAWGRGVFDRLFGSPAPSPRSPDEAEEKSGERRSRSQGRPACGPKTLPG
jgi:hypothetical protein